MSEENESDLSYRAWIRWMDRSYPYVALPIIPLWVFLITANLHREAELPWVWMMFVICLYLILAFPITVAYRILKGMIRHMGMIVALRIVILIVCLATAYLCLLEIAHVSFG